MHAAHYIALREFEIPRTRLFNGLFKPLCSSKQIALKPAKLTSLDMKRSIALDIYAVFNTFRQYESQIAEISRILRNDSVDSLVLSYGFFPHHSE